MSSEAATFSAPLVTPPSRNSGNSQPTEDGTPHSATSTQVMSMLTSSVTASPPSSSRLRPSSQEPTIMPSDQDPLSTPNTVVDACSAPRTRNTSPTFTAHTPATTAPTSTNMVHSRVSERTDSGAPAVTTGSCETRPR